MLIKKFTFNNEEWFHIVKSISNSQIIWRNRGTKISNFYTRAKLWFIITQLCINIYIFIAFFDLKATQMNIWTGFEWVEIRIWAHSNNPIFEPNFILFREFDIKHSLENSSNNSKIF